MAFRPSRGMALLALPLLLSGCGSREGYPSLAPRPAERLSMEEPVRAPIAAAPDAALGARIADLLQEARRGEAEFDQLLPTAQSRSGAAGAAGSESWIEAQLAISRLEAARARTVTALARLDELATQRAGMATNAEQYRSLLDAVARAKQLAEGQQSRLDRLRASLSRI